MRCPYCSAPDCRVLDSRAVDEGRTIRRRRTCNQCGRRFNTFETEEHMPLFVIKHGGDREIFDRNKLMNGLIRACDKREKSLESIMELSHKIELYLRSKFEQEVPSKEIGEATLYMLKDFDQVAYIRFASVYRRFNDIQSFKHELDILQNKSTEAKNASEKHSKEKHTD